VANEEHLKILRQGVAAWNDWRKKNPELRPDLGGARFTDENLRGADLHAANLYTAELLGANLWKANLREANLDSVELAYAFLREADLFGANLQRADLMSADLMLANLARVDLAYAKLTTAHLEEANLRGAQLIETDLRNATLTGSYVYGVSVWDIARSVLMELGAIVPAFPKLAVRLMIKKSEHEYGMLDSIRCYRSVVENTYAYEDVKEVIKSIQENIIGPAEAKVKELRQVSCDLLLS
jgi:hypothetical protein